MFHYSREVSFRPPKNKQNKLPDFKYKCEMCEDGGWTSESDLEIHRSTRHFNKLQKLAMSCSEKNPVCLTCVTKFKDMAHLLKHIKLEHLLSSEDARRVEREIFICDVCQQIFFNKAQIEVHIAYKHSTNNIFPCPVCLKNYKAKSLWGHFQFHQLQSLSCCPICLVKRANRFDLKQHLECHNKFYYCGMCGYKTISNEKLDQHGCFLGSKEGNIKNYRKFFLIPKRKLRWKYFAVKNAVKGLVLQNKVFICILCREICTSDEAMKVHVNKYHAFTVTTEKKNKHLCFCGENFFNKLLLKHHVFKMKGIHRVLKDEEKPLSVDTPDDMLFNEDSCLIVVPHDSMISGDTENILVKDEESMDT